VDLAETAGQGADSSRIGKMKERESEDDRESKLRADINECEGQSNLTK
jgi:hypothetical protein